MAFLCFPSFESLQFVLEVPPPPLAPGGFSVRVVGRAKPTTLMCIVPLLKFDTLQRLAPVLNGLR